MTYLEFETQTVMSPLEQSDAMGKWLPDFAHGETDKVGYLPDLTVQRIEVLFGDEADLREAMLALRETLPDSDDNPVDREVYGLFLSGYPTEDIMAMCGDIDETMERIYERFGIAVAIYKDKVAAEDPMEMSRNPVTRNLGETVVKDGRPQLNLVPEVVEKITKDNWQEHAICKETDPEAFFPEKGGSTREAKRICLGCRAVTECLNYALAKDERFGIWGGLSERERRRLKRGII